MELIKKKKLLYILHKFEIITFLEVGAASIHYSFCAQTTIELEPPAGSSTWRFVNKVSYILSQLSRLVGHR